MTFHVVGLPHTITSSENSTCAYTGKVDRFCRMMAKAGHKVFHYGTEDSHPEGAEHVTVVSANERRRWFGDDILAKLPPGNLFNEKEEWWRRMNSRVREEVGERKGKMDFLCLIAGECQRGAVLPDLVAVEYGIGYFGTFCQRRVFESYTHQAAVYARESHVPMGQLFDAVIPNYFDMEKFPVQERKANYLLFVGRLIGSKGIQVAVDTAARTGMKLLVAGQGVKSEGPDGWMTEDGHLLPRGVCEYVGVIGPEKRAELMGGAKALLCPTLYVEPFGGVSVECQATGTAAISTDHGAFAETIVHGETGYRCHTLEQFCWAVQNTHKLCPPWYIAKRARSLYSMERVSRMYQEYFEMLETLWLSGWPEPNDGRKNLDWLSPLC